MKGELVLITGTTGHIGFKVLITALQAGYRVRASIRKVAQIEQIKTAKSIQPYLDNLEFTVVSDITVDGAFDEALKAVVYVEHIASPLAAPTDNPIRDIVEPAIHGTISMLTSCAQTPSIRRVVITSSLAATIPRGASSTGDTVNIYSAKTHVSPLPTGPYNNYFDAYGASKVLAFDATNKFMESKKPHFTVVNVMPTFVIGANELVTDPKRITDGTNFLPMEILLGVKNTAAFVGQISYLDDVAKVHVESLDEKKVLGSANFLVTSGDGLDGVQLESAIEIAQRKFPEAVAKGILPLGGTRPSTVLKLDIEATEKVFGKMKTYEDAVESVAGYYIKLVEGAK